MESMTRTLVVVGHGMVGHKLVQAMVDQDDGRRWRIVVFGEEPRAAYDRVHLSSMFDGTDADGLSLVGEEAEHSAVEICTDEQVVSIDREVKELATSKGRRVSYDVVVLATGSVPFVPPVPGKDIEGCFVYRTIEDVEAIQTWVENAQTGIVVGGGLLGLEAANALHQSDVETHVVEFAPRLMPAQVDEIGGDVLADHIRDLGVKVHTSTTVAAVEAGADGAVSSAVLSPSDAKDDDERSARSERMGCDIVLFSAGIRPRDDLARQCGLTVGPRGGIVVDSECRTSDPSVFAIGECALSDGQIYGLVSPGYQMARVVADVLLGGAAEFAGADMSTKLKLLGVDVASFGDAHAKAPGNQTICYTNRPGGVHKRLVVDVGGSVVGGVMVGDAEGYEVLAQMARGDVPSPDDPAQLIIPAADGSTLSVGVEGLPETAAICSCENVSKGAILDAVASCLSETGTANVAGVKAHCGAGTGCGGCVPQLNDLVKMGLKEAGAEVNNHICEHFPYSRQELFDLIRVEGHRTFASLLAAHGAGRGCEICKPTVASILASLGNGYILDGDQASLQDTNDHFLANLQRDGTYSVVPRVPGGEITPERLIVIGEVARDFNLYTKVTGGQRIDLLGARVDQLPAIWTRLVDAGFESGHAYGKAMRTVKSCVGTNWCRYGVQDSTALAVDLELRYRGLRSPHKIKMAVSGCARECAEAQGKDVGVIATERGWNLYVCGNGGARPRHADLLASDLDTETLVRTIDRFLMFYIGTADRLQRTSTWLEHLEGGIDHVRKVVLEDSLGLGKQLDAQMQRNIDVYECEWKATLEDPDRLARFRSFINADTSDPDIVMVTERDQPRPAKDWERVELIGSPA